MMNTGAIFTGFNDRALMCIPMLDYRFDYIAHVICRFWLILACKCENAVCGSDSLTTTYVPQYETGIMISV